MSGGFLRGGMKKQSGMNHAGLLHPIGAAVPRFSPLLHKRSTQQHWHLASDPAPGIQSGCREITNTQSNFGCSR